MAKENVVNKINLLLRSGKFDEADTLIVTESRRVEKQIADLTGKITILEAGLGTLRSLMPEGGQQSLLIGGAEGPDTVKLTKSQKHERREAILRVARIVSEDKRSFSPDDIALVLAKDGVPMGVQPNRVNTAIGSCLRGSYEFEKDLNHEGLYKRKDRNIDVQEGDKEPETVVDGGIQ